MVFSILKKKKLPPLNVGHSISSDRSPTSTASDSDRGDASYVSSSKSSIHTTSPPLDEKISPVLTLMKCQSTRPYVEGVVMVSTERPGSIAGQDNTQFQQANAAIRGNSLLLNTQRSVSLDLLEAAVKVIPGDLTITLSTSNKISYLLKFDNLNTLQEWLAAIHLANFEYTRFNEIYTASLLSAKATLLSDVHVLMAPLNYRREEWVNIKFNKNSQWLRCFVIITPSSKKSKGKMTFYSSSRTVKKNLICSITHMDACHAVYPHVPEMIDESSLIKVSGDIKIYNLGHQPDDFDIDTPTEFTPPHSPVQLKSASRLKRAASLASIGSFASQKQNTGHGRTDSIGSTASVASNSSDIKDGVVVHQSAMYIMPLKHGGVKPYETMIRNLIPIYDCFKMYGRPQRLIADKKDSNSLLFGLPCLPKVNILSSKVATNLIRDNWQLICSNDNVDYYQMFIVQLQSLYRGDSNYQGHGSIKKSLTRDSMFEHPFHKSSSFGTPDSQSPRYSLSVNDLPAGMSQDAIDRIQKSTDDFANYDSVTPRVRSNSSLSNNSRVASQPWKTDTYKNLRSMVEEVKIGGDEEYEYEDAGSHIRFSR